MPEQDVSGKWSMGWLDYLKAGWPVLAGACAVALVVGQRLETPEQKQDRIDRSLLPLLQLLELTRDEVGRALTKSDVVNERLRDLERDVGIIKWELTRDEEAELGGGEP